MSGVNVMDRNEQASSGFERKLDKISKRLDQIRKGETEPRAAVFTATGDHFSVVVRTAVKKKQQSE